MICAADDVFVVLFAPRVVVTVTATGAGVCCGAGVLLCSHLPRALQTRPSWLQPFWLPCTRQLQPSKPSVHCAGDVGAVVPEVVVTALVVAAAVEVAIVLAGVVAVTGRHFLAPKRGSVQARPMAHVSLVAQLQPSQPQDTVSVIGQHTKLNSGSSANVL